MTQHEEDWHRAAFEAAPEAMLIADDHRRYLAVNDAGCRLLGRSRADILCLRVEDVSPAGADVEQAWREFIDAGDIGGEYTLVRPDGTAVEVEFHAKANVVPGRHLSIMRDVSERKRLERERDQVNAQLREARDEARRIAVTLQTAMLPTRDNVDGLEVARRYLPALDALRVGGDWYDLVELDPHRVGVAVGDVMGHGIVAAGVMGQLRSALAAALHGRHPPGEALVILDRFARSLGEVQLATAMAAILDRKERTLTYSNAGHPPALVLDDEVRFLDQAVAPPLTASLDETASWPETTVRLRPDATLVFFTDGLVERRGEDIDVGLERLLGAARALAGQDCDTIADGLLLAMLAGEGRRDDDVALLVIRV